MEKTIFDFHLALGQFLNYRLVLEETEPERILYLAQRGKITMDKLSFYRQCIQQLLTKQSQGNLLNGNIESETVFDLEKDRYLLIDLGWNKNRRIYNCVIHLEIRGDKVWIQRNQTDRPIANDLIEMGIAKEDIVLGLQPYYLRPYTSCFTNSTDLR